jgi:hypothetical protein
MSLKQHLLKFKIGDIVDRHLGGWSNSPMQLRISEIDETKIHCGPWCFDKTTGGEIDEDLGWDGRNYTGSFIVPEGYKHDRVG